MNTVKLLASLLAVVLCLIIGVAAPSIARDLLDGTWSGVLLDRCVISDPNGVHFCGPSDLRSNVTVKLKQKGDRISGAGSTCDAPCTPPDPAVTPDFTVRGRLENGDFLQLILMILEGGDCAPSNANLFRDINPDTGRITAIGTHQDVDCNIHQIAVAVLNKQP